MTKLILATNSRSQQKFFSYLNYPFVSEEYSIKKCLSKKCSQPDEFVKHSAQLKAESVAKKHSEEIVIGLDSVGYFNFTILEKPNTLGEVLHRLKFMSGKTFQLYTGIYLINTKTREFLSDYVKTDLEMRVLKEQEIIDYLKQDENFNSFLLGYDPAKNLGSTFIKNISGSYNNLLFGLPLEVIVDLLPQVGYSAK